jgi:hypothetical protein
MLSRCVATSLLCVGTIAGVQWYRCPASAQPVRGWIKATVDPRTAPEAQAREWLYLEDKAQRRERFMHFEEAMLAQLARQEVDLRDTVDRLFYYSLNQYPEHLDNIATVEPGRDIKTKLGQNLLRAIRIAHTYGEGDFSSVIVRLDSELHELTQTECGETAETSR